jgi:translation initiation factor IF-2
MTNSQKNHYPPVISVLGHVDHGKTTLLDAIRKSNIAAREHGGITQKIGASTITIMHDGQKRKVTFIDTPGHEAFSKMRGRGAQAADIGLLIVSAVDGVMPQTKESIQLLQHAGIPFIVVLTKSDSEEKNPEKVKQQLVRENVLLEGYGGDIPVIEISARTGFHIQELLDLILLVWEVKQSSVKEFPSENNPLQAIIIESKLDPKAGSRATAIIKDGSIAIKDEVATQTTEGKVRSLITSEGQFVQKASIGDAVEILGFIKVPSVGEIVINKKQGQKEQTKEEQSKKEQALSQKEGKNLSLILCADTLGSLEAIVHSLPPEVYLVEQKTGDISEGDILHAKSTGAVILTFNTKLRPDILKFALTEKVLLKNYTIIYEMLDEIQQVIEGKQLALMEQIFGVAKILATFPYEKTIVLGVSVLDGRVARGDKVRIVRGEDTIIGESQVVSVRQGKETITKMEKGQECGIIISPMLDITIGDMVVCHS